MPLSFGSGDEGISCHSVSLAQKRLHSKHCLFSTPRWYVLHSLMTTVLKESLNVDRQCSIGTSQGLWTDCFLFLWLLLEEPDLPFASMVGLSILNRYRPSGLKKVFKEHTMTSPTTCYTVSKCQFSYTVSTIFLPPPLTPSLTWGKFRVSQTLTLGLKK